MKLRTLVFAFIVIFAFAMWGAILRFAATHTTGAGRTPTITLAEARKLHTTHLSQVLRDSDPVEKPDRSDVELVHYPGPLGQLPGYVCKPARAATKSPPRHPAIIWLVGGLGNGLSSGAWTPEPPKNDQSAMVFWEEGVFTMHPSLRGRNGAAGSHESDYGEVDDILAARAYLATRADVDPNRIYLGGHSTGGTRALLVAECSPAFRAVFAFGPVADTASYGSESIVFDSKDATERKLRAPIYWLQDIRTPTFVIEGDHDPSNVTDLRGMQRVNHSPFVHFHEIKRGTHFTSIQPMSRLIAQKILADTGPTCAIQFSVDELARLIGTAKVQ